MQGKGACSSGGKLCKVQKGPCTLLLARCPSLLASSDHCANHDLKSRVGPALPHQLSLDASHSSLHMASLWTHILTTPIFSQMPLSLGTESFICIFWTIPSCFYSNETLLSLRILPPLQPSQNGSFLFWSTTGLGKQVKCTPKSTPFCFQMTFSYTLIQPALNIRYLDQTTLSLI